MRRVLRLAQARAGLSNEVRDTRCRKSRCVRIHRAIPQPEDAAKIRQAGSEVLNPFTTVRDFGVEPISRFDTGMDVEEHGAEVLGQFSPDLSVFARYSNAERGGDVLRQAQASLEWRPGEYNALTAEVRRIEERRQAQATAAGMLGAVKYTHRFGTALDLYGIGQVTLDDDGGQYEDNDALTLG